MVKQWSHMVSHEVNEKSECYWSRLKLSFLRHFYGITHDLFPAINTFFYVKLRMQGPDSAAHWLPNVTSCRHLIVPLHLKGTHWALGVVMNLNATTLHEVFLFSEWMVRHQPAFIACGRIAAMRVRIGFYGWGRRSCFILPTYNRVLVKFILSKKFLMKLLQIFVQQTAILRVFSQVEVSLGSLWSSELILKFRNKN